MTWFPGKKTFGTAGTYGVAVGETLFKGCQMIITWTLATTTLIFLFPFLMLQRAFDLLTSIPIIGPYVIAPLLYLTAPAFLIGGAILGLAFGIGLVVSSFALTVANFGLSLLGATVASTIGLAAGLLGDLLYLVSFGKLDAPWAFPKEKISELPFSDVSYSACPTAEADPLPPYHAARFSAPSNSQRLNPNILPPYTAVYDDVPPPAYR